MKKWTELEPGILTDSDIRELCSQNLLIKKNFNPVNVKQTCYELRASEIVWYTYRKEPEARREKVEEGIHIPPNTYATILTLEELEIPDDCVARIMTKGQLFSIGLSSVNTYADPGFSGKLGITFINHSNKNIFIPIGEPIAKIEFDKLKQKVASPYRGRHIDAQNLWPIYDRLFKIPNDQKNKIPEGFKGQWIIDLEENVRSLKRWNKFYSIFLVPLSITMLLFWILNWDIILDNTRALIISSSISGSVPILKFFSDILGITDKAKKILEKKKSNNEYSR